MSIRAQTRFAALAILFASIFLTACASGEKIQSNALSRIAFGSCAGDWVDQPIWDAIADQNPDLYISMGDAIYADWDGEKLVEVTPVSLREKWDELAQLPGFAKLRKNVPMIATWDNHDYGSHDRGADFALKEDSKAIFLDFWDEPDNSVRRRSSGIFADYFYGDDGNKTHIILLDTKSFRTDAQLLGDQQWSWLKNRLQQPADLKVIVSGTQIIPDEKGMDEWGNYPEERQFLLDIAEKHKSKNLILLSGNVHFAEISRLNGLTEITSSGMTEANINKTYAAAGNSYRVSGPIVEPNFGVLEIDWEQSKVSVYIRNESGAEVLKHSISIK